MLKTSLIRIAQDNQHQELVIFDDSLKSQISNRKIYAIPAKLPMIVKPKPHSTSNSGGYLLNDVNCHENLIIENRVFKYKALFNEEICDMVNKISGTAFKINTMLLGFITDPVNEKYNLLMNPAEEHEYAKLKRTRARDRLYKSYNSKVILQETIL